MTDTLPPDLLRSLARVNVVGTSGTGKSVFSRRLAALLDAPHIEMDRLFWRANWQQAPASEFDAELQVALQTPRWVLDGNYSRSIPIKWENVDAVIWLDYPFLPTLTQAVRRAVQRAWSKQELWPGTGNRESFRQSFFSRQSIIWWTIRTYTKTRHSYEARMTDPAFARLRFIRLRNRAEADAFLQQMQQALAT